MPDAAALLEDLTAPTSAVLLRQIITDTTLQNLGNIPLPESAVAMMMCSMMNMMIHSMTMIIMRTIITLPTEDQNRNNPYNDSYNNPYNDRDYDRRSSGRKRSGGGVKLAAPIKKGGKALSRLTSTLLQQLSIVLILATTAFVLYNFYRASTPYGDIQEAIQTQKISQTLAAYLCVAALFLFFEFISLLWSMTRVRVRDGVSAGEKIPEEACGLLSLYLRFPMPHSSSARCSLIHRKWFTE